MKQSWIIFGIFALLLIGSFYIFTNWLAADQVAKALISGQEVILDHFNTQGLLENIENCSSRSSWVDIDWHPFVENDNSVGERVVTFDVRGLRSSLPENSGKYSALIKNGMAQFSIDPTCHTELGNEFRLSYHLAKEYDILKANSFIIPIEKLNGDFKIGLVFLRIFSVPRVHEALEYYTTLDKDITNRFAGFTKEVTTTGELKFDLAQPNQTSTLDWSKVRYIVITVSGIGEITLGKMKLTP